MLERAMISPDQALEEVLSTVSPLGAERVGILAARGRVLAEQIHSPRDIPGFDNSAMDGFALRSADTASAGERNPVRLKVIVTVAAGAMPTTPIGPGQAARTMTGAPIAAGADAVVPIELTGGDETTVELTAPVEPRACIRPRGEDVKSGEAVLAAGKVLSPADIGMLASLNRSMVDVRRRPRVAIVATGDELIDVDQIPTGAQVVNSSAYALAAGVAEAGGEPVILKIARDRPEEIRERLAEALELDVTLSTGGVSVGRFDHVKRVLDALGVKALFHGVAQRPGKPLKFGTVAGRPVFGLPGNPVSTMVCFYLYVRPALLRLGGHRQVGLERVEARCARDIRLARNFTEFVRVRLERRDGESWAIPTGSQGSGILSSLSRADGLLVGPAKSPVLSAGAQATVLLLASTGAEAFFEERLRQRN